MRTRTTGLLVALTLAGAAQAAPADIFILIDSSGSMSRPLGTGDARLVVAKQTARDVITAVKAQHRVGLARFAQLDRVLPGGEGKRPVLREDDQQCERGSNLLAGVDLAGSDEALRWLDGVNELGNPEIMPLGDSPLVRGVEVAVQYIRNKRKADPIRHCVNAVLIVITDGVDTCVGGSEVRGTLADLAQKAAREDIRTLVLSFTPEAEAAQAVAKIGDPDGTPFSDPVKLVAAARAITGRLAPEACLSSGVEPRKLGLPLPAEPDGGTACVPVPASGCGCDSSSAVPFIAILAMTAAFSTRRRRRVLVSSLFVMLFVGCAQTRPTCDIDTGTMPVSSLKEPAQVRDDALSRLPVLLAGAEATRREILAPLLVPEQVFAKVSDADGCLTLVRSIGFEPYLGIQRGVAGCLATRRCNSFDKALLLQACLRTKGASAELELCNETPMAMRQQLLAEAQKAVVMPDLSAAVAKEREVTLQVVGDAQRASKLDTLTAERDVAVKQFFSGAIATDVSTLMPLAGLDAVATDTEATARAAAGLVRYGFVRSGGRALDPTLAGSAIETGACADGPLVPAQETVTIEAQVLLGYVGGSGAWNPPPIVAATTTVKPFESFGEVLSMGVTEATTQTLGLAVPPPASSGCLRAFFELGATRVRGQPFHIGPGDAAACPEPSLSVDEGGRRLSRVTLRLTTTIGNSSTVIDRVLVDRYGYAPSEAAARANGPMYSDATARRLLPMRADLRIVSGVLSPAALLDARLRELALRRPELEAQIAEVAGVPFTPPPPGPPSALPYAILGAVTHFAPPELGAGLALMVERPWLLSQVRRRGFGVSGASLDVVEQSIVDVLDAPLLVVRTGTGTDATGRLRAQIAMGALVTEAETVAAFSNGFDGAVSATTMLHDPALAGKWSAMDPEQLNPALFPVDVIEAAAAYAGDVLVSTPGPVVSDGKAPLIAWWRFDKRTGRGLGELRFEGTFYGGVPGMLATANLLVDLDKCLYAGAGAALMGAEECDLTPCFKAAFDHYKTALAKEYAGAALFAFGGAAGFHHSSVFQGAEYGWEMYETVHAWLRAGGPLESCH